MTTNTASMTDSADAIYAAIRRPGRSANITADEANQLRELLPLGFKVPKRVTQKLFDAVDALR